MTSLTPLEANPLDKLPYLYLIRPTPLSGGKISVQYVISAFISGHCLDGHHVLCSRTPRILGICPSPRLNIWRTGQRLKKVMQQEHSPTLSLTALRTTRTPRHTLVCAKNEQGKPGRRLFSDTLAVSQTTLSASLDGSGVLHPVKTNSPVY